MPPLLQRADLAAGKEHQSANVFPAGPDILPLNPIATPSKPSDRRIIGRLQILALDKRLPIATTDGDGKHLRSRMNQHDISALSDPTACKGKTSCTRFGVPDLPVLRL